MSINTRARVVVVGCAVSAILGSDLAACTSEERTIESACISFNRFIDEEALGIRTVEESRNDFRSQVHNKASSLQELKDASNEVMRGYSYYVDGSPQASSVLEAAFDDFGEICYDRGYTRS